MFVGRSSDKMVLLCSAANYPTFEDSLRTNGGQMVSNTDGAATKILETTDNLGQPVRRVHLETMERVSCSSQRTTEGVIQNAFISWFYPQFWRGAAGSSLPSGKAEEMVGKSYLRRRRKLDCIRLDLVA